MRPPGVAGLPVGGLGETEPGQGGKPSFWGSGCETGLKLPFAHESLEDAGHGDGFEGYAVALVVDLQDLQSVRLSQFLDDTEEVTISAR